MAFMKDAIERLRALRSRNENEIQQHMAAMDSLGQQIQALRCQNVGIEASIRELTGESDQELTPTFNGVGKYSDLSLSDAIEDVVNAYGTGHGLLTKEIITKLLAEGFKTGAKDFYSSVYAVAQRLVQTKRITEGKKDGKRSFVSIAGIGMILKVLNGHNGLGFLTEEVATKIGLPEKTVLKMLTANPDKFELGGDMRWRKK